MATVPYIPNSAPFTPEQRAWLNGFLAGLFASGNSPEAPAAPAPKKEPLLVMYGSQTGTAEGLAKRFSKEAEKRGFAPAVMELNAFASVDWTQPHRLVMMTSTWGDGDPPDNAAAFWSFLAAESAPKLASLSYAVLALGDKNYSSFCGAGKKFDERLEQLGAKRLHSRADCDTDYEAGAQTWMDSLWAMLAEAAPAASAAPSSAPPAAPAVAEKPGWSRNNPFSARLVANRRLSAESSDKETRHFEISLDSSIAYEAGDALGVMPSNCSALVDDLLRALGATGDEAVPGKQGCDIPLREALRSELQITSPGADLLKAVADRAQSRALRDLLDPARKSDLDKYLCGREVIDLLLEHPGAKFDPREFAGLLRKLQPRLYSISSSPKAHPNQVHLTVSIVRYDAWGRKRKGVCSSFLADRVELNTAPLPVFVQTSHGFRLPSDSSVPVIMVGPGTGIAPFRAFLEERQAVGGSGKNWLFFGDQRKATDYLYQDELETMAARGALTRLDTAFSRDQSEKIYVQHRMRENAAELWKWLEEGAHFYVCGDAKRMAKDVDAALHEAIQSAGEKSAEQAAEYVAALKTAKRYQRDVY